MERTRAELLQKERELSTARTRSFVIFLFFFVMTVSLPLTRSVNSAEIQHPEQFTRQVAITVDDLPGSEEMTLIGMQEINRKILSALQSNRVPFVGFVNEKELYVAGETDARIDILRMWLDAGGELGNHTFSHADFNQVPPQVFQDDVIRGEVVTSQLMEERGWKHKYFRYPYNRTGSSIGSKSSTESFLSSRGYIIAPYTIEHSDYIFDTVYMQAIQRRNLNRAIQIRTAYLIHLGTMFEHFEQLSRKVLGYEVRQIFLIHANRMNAECLNQILQSIALRGYSFITLEKALEDPAYQIRDEYVGTYGISWLHRWALSRGTETPGSDPDPPDFVMRLYRAR